MTYTTTLSGPAVMSLVAILTGEKVGRAADKKSAVERFVRLASAGGVAKSSVGLALAAADLPAAQEIVRDAVKSAKKSAAARPAVDTIMEEVRNFATGLGPTSFVGQPSPPVAADDSLAIPGFLKRTGSPEETAAVAAAFERSAQRIRENRAAGREPQPASLGAAAVAAPRSGMSKAELRAVADNAVKSHGKAKKGIAHKMVEKRAQPKAGDGEKSKREIMLDMVCSAKGATEQEICDRIGWKKCRTTLHRAAEAEGITLSSEKKEGERTRYFGKRKGTIQSARRTAVKRGRA